LEWSARRRARIGRAHHRWEIDTEEARRLFKLGSVSGN